MTRSARHCVSIVAFFCTSARRPLGSTPFPYTTLFRSATLEAIAARGTAAFYRGPIANGIAATVAARKDRKSTRLNSSHLGLSYAVFCLKKKTDASTQPRDPPTASAVHQSTYR